MTHQQIINAGLSQVIFHNETYYRYPAYVLTEKEQQYLDSSPCPIIYLCDGKLFVNSGVNTAYRNNIESRIEKKLKAHIEKFKLS